MCLEMGAQNYLTYNVQDLKNDPPWRLQGSNGVMLMLQQLIADAKDRPAW